jgi:hypothetical protein
MPEQRIVRWLMCSSCGAAYPAAASVPSGADVQLNVTLLVEGLVMKRQVVQCRCGCKDFRITSGIM